VYLFSRISKQVAGTGQDAKEAVNAFYNQLEVTVDATFTDNVPITAVPNRSSSSTTTSSLLSQSVPTSPKISQRRTMVETSTPFFTQAYSRNNNKNAESMLFEYQDTFCCLYPIVVPISKYFEFGLVVNS
jgi:hypothetical protein